jgi:hypothetical protein
MDRCIHCGGLGVWRDYHVDELCICVTCVAMTEVAAAIRRQEIEAGLLVVRVVVPLSWPGASLGPDGEDGLGRNRRRKRLLTQGLRSERQRQLKRTRRFQRGVAQLEDDGEHGRTRSHGC